MDRAEAATGAPVRPAVEVYAQGTGGKPLSMYSPDMWSVCFPHLFPYGDGVFGLPRRSPLTFQQLSSMLLVREELEYTICASDVQEMDEHLSSIDAAWASVPAS